MLNGIGVRSIGISKRFCTSMPTTFSRHLAVVGSARSGMGMT
ncbi:hypothetical protein [Mycobacterium phage Fezzik]|nr:hypothetical protein [Mycobacterium phage Fezzik]